MVKVGCVHTISMRTKVVILSTDVFAEPESRVQTIHLPSAVESVYSLWYVLLHSFPEKLSQELIISHEPVIPPIVVHEAVGFCPLVAHTLRCLHHCSALVWRESVV